MLLWMSCFVSIALVLVLLPSAAVGQSYYLGKCPDTPVQEDFFLYKFLGKWFEVERTFALFEAMLQCVTVEYYLREDGKFGIRNTGVDSLGSEQTLNGFVITPDAYHPGRMIVIINSIPIPVNLTILHTDYKNFAVLWSCKELLGGLLGHTENMWILSRKPYLDEETKHVIYQFLVSTGVGLKGLKAVEQISCPHRKVPLLPILDHDHEEAKGAVESHPDDEAFLSRHPQQPIHSESDDDNHHDSVKDDLPTYSDYKRKTGDLPAGSASAKNATRVRFDPRSSAVGARLQKQLQHQRSKQRKQVQKSRTHLPEDRSTSSNISVGNRSCSEDGPCERDQGRVFFNETSSPSRNDSGRRNRNDEDRAPAESAPGYVRFRQFPMVRFYG